MISIHEILFVSIFFLGLNIYLFQICAWSILTSIKFYLYDFVSWCFVPQHLKSLMWFYPAVLFTSVSLYFFHIVEQVLLYDEPTAGLDPIASTVVEDLIRYVHLKDEDALRKPGKIASYVVVTHQHSTIRRAVDRLAVSKSVSSLGLVK